LPADSKYIDNGKLDDSENDSAACNKNVTINKMIMKSIVQVHREFHHRMELKWCFDGYNSDYLIHDWFLGLQLLRNIGS